MAGFEDSIEYKMARAAYEARQKNIERAKSFVNGAQSLCSSAKGAVKKAKESLKNFGHGLAEGIKNNAGKISDSFLEFCSDVKDMGGAMKEMAQEGIGKALKPVRFVGKAALNTFMAGAGYLAGKGTKLAHKMKVKTKGFVLRRIVDGKNFLKNAVNVYTANAIENKKKLRSVRRSIKEGLKNFGYGLKNKFEDLSYAAGEKAGKAKGLFNRISKSVQGKIDTAHYGVLVAKDAAGKFMTDKLDTAHYGALVAKDVVVNSAKNISGSFKEFGSDVKAMGGAMREVAQDAMQPVKVVTKAAANTFMAGAGYLAGKGTVAFNHVKSGVKDFGSNVSEEVKSNFGKISDSFKEFSSDVKAMGGTVIDSLSSGFEQYVSKPVRNQTAAAALAMTVNANVLKADISGKVSSARAAIGEKLGTVKETLGGKMASVNEAVGSVKKVGKEAAKSWLGKVSKTFVGGKKLAGNIVSRIQSGSERALGSVSNTLAGATQSITQGMETARVSVQNRARGDMGAWLRAGKMASYSK